MPPRAKKGKRRNAPGRGDPLREGRGVTDDIVQDPRFATLHRDPRFARQREADTKVAVDERFRAVLHDPRFNDAGAGADALLSAPAGMFSADADADADAGAAGGASDQAGADDGLMGRLEMLDLMARGEMVPSGESETDDDDDVDSDSDADSDAVPRALQEAPDLEAMRETLPDSQCTARLALVNCDWENLTARDVFALVSSFVPSGGTLRAVTVFESDYGSKQLALEDRFGPQGLYDQAGAGGRPAGAEDAGGDSDGAGDDSDGDGTSDGSDTDDDDADDAADTDNDNNDDNDAADTDNNDDDASSLDTDEAAAAAAGEVNELAVRQYELNRMKYYFAIAEFDSAKTASAVYEACDGSEIERTGNIMDLRVVPADQRFDGRPVRDRATGSRLEDYEPPGFYSRALQATRVDLTWDDTDATRRRALTGWQSRLRQAETEEERRRRRSRKHHGGRGDDDSDDDSDDDAGAVALRDEDFAAYIAPGSDEEEEEEDGDDDDDDDDDEGRQNTADKAVASAKANAAKSRRAKRAEQRRLLLALAAGEDVEDAVTAAAAPASADGTAHEITFVPGAAKAMSKRRKAREAAAGETVWEAYQRRRKEKRHERKQAQKAAHAAAGSGAALVAPEEWEVAEDATAALAGDDFFAAAPSAQAGRGRVADDLRLRSEADLASNRQSRRAARDEAQEQARAERADAAREAAELALVSMPDPLAAAAVGVAETEGRGYDARALVRAQKDAERTHVHSRKQKRRRDAARELLAADDFRVDVADDRFGAVHSDARFAIDPTSTEFKDTAGMRQLLKARQEHRRAQKKAEARRVRQRLGLQQGADGEGTGTGTAAGAAEASGSGGGSADVAALVARVKSKAKRQQRSRK